MAEQTVAEKAEQWRDVGAELYAGAIEAWLKSDSQKWVVDTIAKVFGELAGVGMVAMAPLGITMAKSMANAEDLIAPAFGDFAAAGVNDVFGTNVSGAAFGSSRAGGGRGGAGDALGRALMDQLKGASGEITPSDAAAAKYVNAMATMAIEDWFKGWFFEVLSSLIPQIDIGKIENYGALGDKVAGVLGLGLISRRVLSPIVDASIVTPLRWQVEKTYRPQLLAPSLVAKQITRRLMSREDGFEELARQGYSDRRIEALLNAERKFFSASDVRQFVAREHWTRDQGIAHLKDQGYDDTGALDALRLDGLRRFDQHEGAEASAIIGAYANWEISDGTFHQMLGAAVSPPAERALYTELAGIRRELGRPRLSVSQVEQMVKSGVLSILDYRRTLRERGYVEDDVMALELQLRFEIDKATDIAAARAEREAEREAEQLLKAQAAEARRLEVEAERAAARRGPLAKIERAAVRGLIPLSRVEELYAADYDGDTVAILLGLVEADRLAYLEAQTAAGDAGRRAAQRGLNLGELQSAVMANILTLDEFRGRLASLGLSAADAGILTATLGARKADQDAAVARRRDVETTAAKRRISLSQFETLVRRGARTLAQYDALLGELDVDETDRAALVELLQLKIADDAAARAERERAAAALASRGLSLEQFERAVILGVKTLDEYSTFLRTEGFTADAQIALRALLEQRVEDANAARARRQATPPRSGGRELSLATVRRAARLGVISPDTYADRLAREGYALEDIELDVELLLTEIADVQAKRAARDEAEGAALVKGLSLAQLEQGIKAGHRSIDDYRARAATLGYGGADLELLVDLLADELEQTQDARDRRDEIDGELVTRELSLGQLEAAVKQGLGTLEQFAAEVRALGYGTADAELLTALLAGELAAAADGETGGA